MSLVITRDDRVEEPFGFPSALILSWVVVSAVSLAVGLAIGRCCLRKTPTLAVTLPAGPWERLVRKALFYVGRRRRVSLAFGNYRDQTLRNTAASRPNTSRRELRQRAQTPTPPRALNEGPAVIRSRR